MSDERRGAEGKVRDVQPGGSASRGVNPDPGGETEPGGLVPPYEGRTTERGESEISEELGSSVERMLLDADGGGGGQTASPAVESPVRDEEVSHETPESPMGVGTSPNRSAEDVADRDGKESGREDSGTQTPSGRPAGTSDARDVTGVHPQSGNQED
jgi:hypothetical protein